MLDKVVKKSSETRPVPSKRVTKEKSVATLTIHGLDKMNAAQRQDVVNWMRGILVSIPDQEYASRATFRMIRFVRNGKKG